MLIAILPYIRAPVINRRAGCHPAPQLARLAAALFEQTGDAVTADTVGVWFDQKTILAEVLDMYGVALIA